MPNDLQKPEYTSRAAESEPETTTQNSLAEDASGNTTEQQSFQEPQADEQSTNEHADVPHTTEFPTIIQMHNQQQDEQQQHEQQQNEQQQNDQQQEEEQQEQQDQGRNNAFAFESLEKAFATSVPHKIRSTKDLEQPQANTGDEQLPWSWAKDIMLQKPVLKKSSQEIA